MTRLLLSITLVLVFASAGLAVPMRTAEYGTVPQREYGPAQDVCALGYYNICSGWVWYWSGYCGGFFDDNLPVKYGTCFDLDDCDPECRSLLETWWSMKRFTSRGLVDIEIFCADELCCPFPTPVAGIYGYVPDVSTPWQHFVWDIGCLPCVEEEFVVMITDWTAGLHTSPYSDHVPLNVEAGCQDWRCAGHSFVYKNVIEYCLYYGMPAPMWVSGLNYGCTNVPSIPAGCHDYVYTTGVYTEFLIDCHVMCLGWSPTEKSSWSEIKTLYR